MSVSPILALRSLAPSLSPTPTAVRPRTGSVAPNDSFGAQSLANAIGRNVQTELGAPAAPMATSAPYVGSAGSANNAGNIAGAANNASFGPGGIPNVGRLALFQAQNPTADLALRIALPVGGFLLFHAGHTIPGIAAMVGGGALWGNRLMGLNL